MQHEIEELVRKLKTVEDCVFKTEQQLLLVNTDIKTLHN